MTDICKSSIPVRAVDYVFFDSGTGGIPYMLHLKEKYPQAFCVYVADTRNFPYGPKSGFEIQTAAEAAVRLILRHFKPGAVVIGCNTISVTALEHLRSSFPDFLFVGTVPAIKQAAAVSGNRRIGLLATQRTVDEPYTAELAKRFAPDCALIKRADPRLIDFIEHDFFTASESEKTAAVKPAVDFFAENRADTIILGCTHFLHIASTLADAAGEGVRIVDSKDGVVNQALRVGSALAAVNGNAGRTIGNAKGSAECTCADCSFFITGPENIDERPYRILSENLNIPYGGILAAR